MVGEMVKQVGMTILLGVMIMGLFGCSSETKQYSPEQVINNALEEADLPGAYYGEIESTTSEKGEKKEEIIMKEWRDDNGKTRVEATNKDGSDQSIAVNDGNEFISYEVGENQAYMIDDPELLEFNQPSPKEQANNLLDMVRDTHEITTEGDAEIAGRNTYHLIAKAKEENTLFGDQELWIDKENWMVLKMTLNSGESKTEMTYTKIDFDPKIPAKIFTLDLPADVEVKNLDDISNESEITLEEAKENIGEFRYFPENEEMDISTIEMIELQGEIKRKEVNIDYKKDDLPLLTLSVFDSPEETDEDTLEFPGEKAVTIRDQEGSFTESSGFRSLLWQEEGKNYSIILIDPNLTLEDLKEMTEGMEIVE